MKTGDYVDMENLENRHIVYVKVFLSDIRNQYAALLESQLWHDYLSHVPCSVVGQAPLDGSKVSLLVCTSDASSASSFCSLRLCEADMAGKDAYGQAVALFEKFVVSANLPMTLQELAACACGFMWLILTAVLMPLRKHATTCLGVMALMPANCVWRLRLLAA